MPRDPIKDMVKKMGSRIAQAEHSDIVLNNGRGRRFRIVPSGFSEITPVKSPLKIAFVDGGNGTLTKSPNHITAINRTYYTIFQGKKRIRPSGKNRIQFFSNTTMTVIAEDEKDTVRHDTGLFAYTPEDREYLPDEADLTTSSKDTTLQDTRLSSIARRFSEWQMAIHVVEEELDRGDIIVMDGSLQTGFENESKYTDKLYRLAKDKGVIVCGLAKTSKLITESGAPLLARVAEIAENVPYGMWYVKIAEKISHDDRGFTMAVRLHEKAQFIFRFEILLEQFEQMSPDELNMVLGSLAENSRDIAMPGYPYGAIDADRFAQIRTGELNMYRQLVQIEMCDRPELKRQQKYDTGLTAHDTLNDVTS